MRRGARGLAALAALTAVALAGCQAADDTRASVPRAADSASPSPLAPTPGPPDPSDAAGVLAHYDVTLPPSAKQAVAGSRPDDVMTDGFLVTFTAPASEVADMCRDAGVGDPLVATTVLASDLQMYELRSQPQAARTCGASNPDNPGQQIRVLFHGDPASVHVALWTMPVR